MSPPSSAPQAPQPIAITLFGAGGCGKSSLTLSLVRSAFTTTYDPTIEDSYTITRRIDGVEYEITLTDTAGQEEYRGLWAQDALLADGFVLVYDITNRGTLDELQWFESIVGVEAECREERAEAAARMRALNTSLKDLPGQLAPSKSSRSRRGTGVGRSRRNTNATETPPPLPLPTSKPIKIVAGNKVDLANSREVPAREGLEWARRHGCGFMETSARERVNVEETFMLVVRRVVEARRAEEQRIMEEEYALRQVKRTDERSKYAVSGGAAEWDIGRRATVDWTKDGRSWQEAGGQRPSEVRRAREREARSRDGSTKSGVRSRTRDGNRDRTRERDASHKPERKQRPRLDEKTMEREAEKERERKLRARHSESGIALRHAPTAPLSPLTFDEFGNEKKMRFPGPKGEIPPTKKGWAWLRCW